MWHKKQKDLFSYYSKQKVNGVMGVNGIMRTCLKHISFRDLPKVVFPKIWILGYFIGVCVYFIHSHRLMYNKIMLMFSLMF